MELTIFLAQLWGPILLALGVGMFTNRRFYGRIYGELEDSPLALLVFGLVAMVAGTAHVLVHQTWGTPLEAIITFLGWGLLGKGVLFIVAPNFVDRAGDGWLNLKLLPLAAGLVLILGFVLVWFGYLAY